MFSGSNTASIAQNKWGLNWLNLDGWRHTHSFQFLYTVIEYFTDNIFWEMCLNLNSCLHCSCCDTSYAADWRGIRVRGHSWSLPCRAVGFHMWWSMGRQWCRSGVSTARAKVKIQQQNSHKDPCSHTKCIMSTSNCETIVFFAWNKKKGMIVVELSRNQLMWVSNRLSLPQFPELWQVFLPFRHTHRRVSCKEHLGSNSESDSLFLNEF